MVYKTCPKCGYQAGPPIQSSVSCAACGLIYEKYLRTRLTRAQAVTADTAESKTRAGNLQTFVSSYLLETPEVPERTRTWARAALLALLTFYGLRLARMDVPSWEMFSSLMHLPMVPIHEFGHVLFRPFGSFMHLLGGSLFQAGLPLVFGAIFVCRNRDPFAAAVMLWWSAVAVMDIAPYVYDAQQPVHVLLTGRTGETGAHDFIDVLGDLNLLTRAQSVGYAVHRCGVAMLVVACAWSAVVLRHAIARAR